MTTTFTNNFSEETWKQKYKFGDDKTVDDSFRRTAKDLASVEEDKEYWADKFYEIMEHFAFVPGGRILSNAGTGLTGTTYINCFVDGFLGKDQDSIEGIYSSLLRQAQILKSEGGYGFCCSVMRPKGSHIGGIGNQSPGAVKFLELWDTSSSVITAGSGAKANRKDEKDSIRKGAQMVTIHCWHPDVFEFIEAKKTKGRLSKFNMSVLCSNEFMNKVIDGGVWELKFPNYEKYSKEYKEHWDGNLQKWMRLIDKEDSVIVHTQILAKDLWETIMENTYNRNEPGVLFIDTMNNMNNLWYCEEIMATNPCGEQILPNGGVCLLGSINLTQFVDRKNRNWDFKKLKKFIPIAVRLMDNVNDKTHVPLPSQKKNLQEKRRIGLGLMGYGSSLMMIGVRYGSDEALELTSKLMDFIANNTYQASAVLAKEKGSFPLLDKEKYLQSKFVSKLSKETRDLIAKHGIRNSHLLSIQPNGNTGVLANIITGGLEPSFSVPGYFRTAVQTSTPEGLEIPKHVDWKKKTFECKDTKWNWAKEGDEELLVTKFEDKVWKFDRTRGLLKEEWIEDYGIQWLRLNKLYDKDDPAIVSAMELTVDDHVKTMAIFANGVDSAISKTINVKNDYPYTDFKQVYLKAWQNGVKGFTTYREGTMATVLSTKSSYNDIKSRPKELICDVYHVSVKTNQYFVLVGLDENKRPYEIFAGKNGFLAKDVKTGRIIKKGKAYKAIFDDEDNTELSPITSMCNDHEEAVTRLSSALLRTGNLLLIVEQLEKVHGDMTAFAKALARTLKKYIKDGTESQDKCPECAGKLIYAEGCKSCQSCGYSKCL